MSNETLVKYCVGCAERGGESVFSVIDAVSIRALGTRLLSDSPSEAVAHELEINLNPETPQALKDGRSVLLKVTVEVLPMPEAEQREA